MKKLLTLLLAFSLVCALTGCDELDYRKAIDLYNQRKYDAAAEAFAQLDGYEDSGNMITRSNYWAAIDLMEAGEFSSALPRFIKLGDFEDSALRVTECKYQIALQKFEAGNYEEAQGFFEEVTDYKQAQEYLRRIHWQAMYDAIAAHPIEVEQNGKLIHMLAEPNLHTLWLSIAVHTDPPFAFSDDLSISLTRDSTIANFSAGSDFGMAFVEGRIGASQIGYGRLDTTTCTPETPLVMETFEKHVADNQGNSTDSTDPADSTMNEIMEENMQDLMTTIPQLLLDAGIEVTLQDIGFYALN